MKSGYTKKYRVFMFAFFLTVGFSFLSCKKDPSEPATPVVVVDYMRLNSSASNQLEVTSVGAGEYELSTTGEDPYVSLFPLKKNNAAEKVVFIFEYKCLKEISHLQVFFGSPITEERSLKTAAIPVAVGWNSYSVDVGIPVSTFNWGHTGDFLRLDFGNQAGVFIQIRNICLRVRTADEEALAREKEEAIANDLLLESNLKKYLSANFSSQITEVKVSPSMITIHGNYSGEGNARLCEIMPSDQLTETGKFRYTYSLESPSFTVDLDRFAVRDGIEYDRVLSKWVIAKIGDQSDEIISHARYADEISSTQNMTAQRPAGRKGLGGYSVNRGFGTDLDDLQITSVTVNIAFTQFMYLQSRGGSIVHTYGDKTYYFDQSRVEELDRTMQTAQSKNIVVAAIILVQKASQCADPEIGQLLQHPDFTSEGIYTMPNMTTPASVNCYAAALDFLASRYCRSDNSHGRIHHWIMHNEVDAGLSWTNMGEKPMLVYMDTYIKSMRLCYNITREYDANSEVFGSFTHSWAEAAGSKYYATKDMLKILQDYSNAEGDFQWGLAYHPYPQDLNEPKTWNDTKATFSMNSPLVTFKNLEVLDAWIRKSENKYKGTIKRTLWLSENGTNSRTYSDTDLKEQAAGFAYVWKKMKTLNGIDAMQWHNWIDNRSEDGLRIGLRRFPDDESDPGGRKPVWFTYQAADTEQEDAVFEPYKAVIGIQNWDELRYPGLIQ